MKLEFKGIVSQGDASRCDDEFPDPYKVGAVYIGDLDVVDEIVDQPWGDNVRVFLNGAEVANGKVVGMRGYGYSHWTPMEGDEVSAGDCNLIEVLCKLAGQEVTLVVEDT